MRIKKKLLITTSTLTLLYSATSSAGLLVEPLAGYNFVNKFDIDGAKDYKSGAGYGVGGKLGWFKEKGHGLSAGLDYLRSDIDMSSGDFDSNLRSDEWGAFVGYKLPFLFKFYGEYIFSASGNTKLANQKIHLSSGSGWKLGVGCTVLPFLDINLDYRDVSYDKREVGAYMLSVSFPIHLFE